jgi:hypothetical protein
MSLYCWVILLSLIDSFLCLLSVLRVMHFGNFMDMRNQNYLGVLKMPRFISFYALPINTAEGRSFCSEGFFTGNEAKLNQGYSKDGHDRKLGYAHSSKKYRFANLQTSVF